MKVKLLFPLLIVILLGLTPMDISFRRALECVQTTRACEQGQTRAQAYSHILAVEPWRIVLWEDLGDEALLNGAYPDAIKAYQAALEYDALTIRGRVNYGYALYYSGQEEAAEAWWMTLVVDDLAPVELYERLYTALMDDLRITEAGDLLQHWLKRQPENAALQFQAGLLALLRSHDIAQEFFDRAADLDMTLVPVVRSLEMVIAQAHLRDDIAYQQLLIGRETANLGYVLIGELLCAQAVQVNPAYAEAWALLGELQQRNGRDGLPALEQAYALDPQNVLVRSLLAFYWQRQDEPVRAMEYFLQLAAQYPDDYLWQIEAGKSTAQAGDIPAGLQLLVDASLAFPEALQVWTELANFCASYRIELQTYGLTAAREALHLAPEDPMALGAMGNVLFSLNDLESAARYYRQVLDVLPEDSAAFYQLGLIALQQDRTGDARYYFNRVLATSPAYAELYGLAQRNLDAMNGNQ